MLTARLAVTDYLCFQNSVFCFWVSTVLAQHSVEYEGSQDFRHCFHIMLASEREPVHVRLAQLYGTQRKLEMLRQFFWVSF